MCSLQFAEGWSCRATTFAAKASSSNPMSTRWPGRSRAGRTRPHTRPHRSAADRRTGRVDPPHCPPTRARSVPPTPPACTARARPSPRSPASARRARVRCRPPASRTGRAPGRNAAARRRYRPRRVPVPRSHRPRPRGDGCVAPPGHRSASRAPEL
jgi:hypothetical protein